MRVEIERWLTGRKSLLTYLSSWFSLPESGDGYCSPPNQTLTRAARRAYKHSGANCCRCGLRYKTLVLMSNKPRLSLPLTSR